MRDLWQKSFVMKAFKYLGYYLLIAIYYLTIFGILIFTFDPPNKPDGVTPLGLFISLTAILSPFLITKRFLEDVYPGPNKRGQALTFILLLSALTCIHAIGIEFSSHKRLGTDQLSFYAFNACIVISLLIYKPKSEPVLNKLDKSAVSIFNFILSGRYFGLAKLKKTILFTLGGMLCMMIVTNPSLNSFREHIGNTNNGILKKESNWFIFSVYRLNKMRYLGIIGNFFYLKPKIQEATSSVHTSTYESKAPADQDSQIKFDFPIPSKGVKLDPNADIDKEIDEWLKTHRKK
jgi:hypothetical protein